MPRYSASLLAIARRRRLAVPLIACVFLASSLAGCSSGATPTPAASATASPAPSSSASPAAASPSASPAASQASYSLTVLEANQGFYDLPLLDAVADFAPQLGLTLKITHVTGGGALNTEFQGGVGDVALAGVDTPIRLLQKNAVPGGVTVIGTNMAWANFTLVSKKGSPYKSLTDLKGHKASITGAGASSESLLKWAIINVAKMDASAVQLVPLGQAAPQLQAILNGTVQAGMLYNPALSQAEQAGQVQVVYDLSTVPYAQNVWIARTSDLQANPKPYQLFMQAYNQAVNKLETDDSYATSTANQNGYDTGVSQSVFMAELTFYRRQWKDTSFPESLYTSSKDILLKSDTGFPTAGFPTYQRLIQGAPGS